MDNPTQTTADAARYAAWRRMRRDTIAILGGSRAPEHSPDLPHVAAWLAAHARYRSELVHFARNPAGLRAAHQLKVEAEARYVDAILPDEVRRIEAATGAAPHSPTPTP